MKRILSITLFSALLFAAFSCSNTSQEQNLRIVSYNIRQGVADDGPNHWDIRKPATIAMLEDIKPDVMGVQEAYDFQLDYITENCPRYKYVGVGREDGLKGGETMAVFYDTTRVSLKDWGTYWLSETPDIPSMGWDAACPRTATWTLLHHKDYNRDFYFVNTHLDHVGFVARKEGLALIYNRIRTMNTEGLPLILTGDFNILPDDECLQDLNKIMLSARATALDADQCGSFNGFGKNGYSGAAPRLKEARKSDLWPLDYIYYTGMRQCLTFKVITTQYNDIVYISDHYPVCSDIQF